MIVQHYTRLGVLLDGMFSLARTETGKADNNVCSLCERYVTAVMTCLRNLRLSCRAPKIHAIEDHLIDQMRMFKGIGCFGEDFIEQSHQFGLKEESRTRAMKDRAKAALSHTQWELIRNSPEVEKARIKIEEGATRKFKKERKRPAEEQKAKKEQKRMKYLEEVERINDAQQIGDYKRIRFEIT